MAERPYCPACAGHGTSEHDDDCPDARAVWFEKGVRLGYIDEDLFDQIDRELDDANLRDWRRQKEAQWEQSLKNPK